MDGRLVGERLMPEIQREAAELREKHKMKPVLAAILVGADPASRQYVKNKRRMTGDLGFSSRLVELSSGEASTERLLEVIDGLNRDRDVAGILLQLPVPPGVDQPRLFDAIDPLKDVDAVGAAAVAGFYRGGWGSFLPCTPRGVLELLSYYQIDVRGKRTVVVGRSDIAGKPLALILGGRMCNATVTWCHTRTQDLPARCREAELLVSCTGADTGAGYFITADMVSPGACVIDVGFRRLPNGRFVGDVDFDAVSKVAGWITPSPGGTGPMTVVALMQNLIDAGRYQLGLERARYSF
jgi:methylenetetrahydrofolate dehydrogenase (NADP+)/methenyltetrahydrofolate cyclohydrolase